MKNRWLIVVSMGLFGGSNESKEDILLKEDQRVVGNLEGLIEQIETFLQREQNAPSSNIAADLEIETEELKEDIAEIATEVERLGEDLQSIQKDELRRKLRSHGLSEDTVKMVLQDLETDEEEIADFQNRLSQGSIGNPFKAFKKLAADLVKRFKRDKKKLNIQA